MADVAIARVDYGWFVRPGEETASGRSRVEPVLGYVVRHPRGVLLLDTGMGAHPEVDAHYRPRRHGVDAALAAVGLTPRDVGVVVLAGQSHDTASDYAADALAVAAADDPGRDGGPLPVAPERVATLQALDPKLVYFAHDHAVWVPA